MNIWGDHMNKRFWLISLSGQNNRFGSLVLCSLFLACGCIGGTMAAMYVDVSAQGTAGKVILEYVSLLQDGSRSVPGFLSTYLSMVKYHLVVAVFGMSVIGIVLIPALSVFRGFALSFSIAVLARVYPDSGVLFSIASFGITALFSIPTFLVLSSLALSSSVKMGMSFKYGISKPVLFRLGREYFFPVGICLLILIIPTILEMYLVPWVVSFIV